MQKSDELLSIKDVCILIHGKEFTAKQYQSLRYLIVTGKISQPKHGNGAIRKYTLEEANKIKEWLKIVERLELD